jgi:hypothetical protein
VAEQIRIEVNSAGIQALLKSEEVQALLEAKGQRIAAAAGDGFEVSSRIGATRARASVITATRAARKAEAVDRALTSAIDAGRG